MNFDVRVTRTAVWINGEKARRIYSAGWRRVFLTKDYCIKVEWTDESSWKQCRHENRLWKREIEVRDRKHFVPVLCYRHTHSYDYIIQPRIKIRRLGTQRYERLFESVIYPLKKRYGIDDIFMDIKNNWTVGENSIPLIYDYGL